MIFKRNTSWKFRYKYDLCLTMWRYKQGGGGGGYITNYMEIVRSNRKMQNSFHGEYNQAITQHVYIVKYQIFP